MWSRGVQIVLSVKDTKAPKDAKSKRYKSSNDEHGIEDVVLEGEQGQTHVGENEVLCQEIEQLEQLQHKGNRFD